MLLREQLQPIRSILSKKFSLENTDSWKPVISFTFSFFGRKKVRENFFGTLTEFFEKKPIENKDITVFTWDTGDPNSTWSFTWFDFDLRTSQVNALTNCVHPSFWYWPREFMEPGNSKYSMDIHQEGRTMAGVGPKSAQIMGKKKRCKKKFAQMKWKKSHFTTCQSKNALKQ